MKVISGDSWFITATTWFLVVKRSSDEKSCIICCPYASCIHLNITVPPVWHHTLAHTPIRTRWHTVCHLKGFPKPGYTNGYTLYLNRHNPCIKRETCLWFNTQTLTPSSWSIFNGISLNRFLHITKQEQLDLLTKLNCVNLSPIIIKESPHFLFLNALFISVI